MDENDVRESIRRSLMADLQAVDPLPTDRVLAVGVQLTAAVGIGGFLAAMGLRGWRLMSLPQTLALGALAVASAACLAVAFVRTIRPGAPPPPVRIEAVVGALCIGFPIVCGVMFPLSPAQDSLYNGLLCLGMGSLLTIGSCWALFRIARRGVILDGVRAGAAIGALSGVISAVALQAFCPHQDATHLAIWHGLVIAMSIAVGMLAGRKAVID